MNKTCPSVGQQKVQHQPDWTTTAEILKDQAKITFFYTIKMSEYEILMDNLVDPDATIDHYINQGFGGLAELTLKLADLGMPAQNLDDVKGYYYMNITKDDIVGRLSTRAKNKRNRKLWIRELRERLAHSNGNPVVITQKTADERG